MKLLINIAFCILPNFISINLRRFLGAKIEKGAKISYGALLFVDNKNLSIGKNTVIKPFTIIRSQILNIGDNSIISSFNKINVNKLIIGNYVRINTHCIFNGNEISIGDHSRVFEYCYFEADKSITIGKKVGIGGHCLIFNHGSWSNYLEGAPVSFGSVTIEDNVWLPWRVFILPNVTIGKDSIIGGNSLVNSSIPENTLAAGSPAKVIKENIIKRDQNIRLSRLEEIIKLFNEQHELIVSINDFDTINNASLIINCYGELSQQQIEYIHQNKINYLDYENEIIYIHIDNLQIREFITFLSIYGVRLYEK